MVLFQNPEHLKWLLPTIPFLSTVIIIDETFFGLILNKVNNEDYKISDACDLFSLYNEYFIKLVKIFNINYPKFNFIENDVLNVINYIKDNH